MNTSITNAKVNPASRISSATGDLFAGYCVGKRAIYGLNKPFMIEVPKV